MSTLQNEILLESLFEEVQADHPNLTEDEQIALTKQLFEDLLQWQVHTFLNQNVKMTH